MSLYRQTGGTADLRFARDEAGARTLVQRAGVDLLAIYDSGLVWIFGVARIDGGVQVLGNQIIGARGAAVADAAGGAVIDTQARTAINALLARCRAHGLIDP